jgi:hypothetical protein
MPSDRSAMSVANTLTSSGLPSAIASSIRRIASVYASSPLEQAVTQARTLVSGSRDWISGRTTCRRSASHASASRKKPVTWMNRSSAKASASDVFCRSARA